MVTPKLRINRRSIMALALLGTFMASTPGCRPAWHKSGKMIAVSFCETDGVMDATEEGSRSGVILYDLETDSARILHQEKGWRFELAQCLWTSDGTSLVVVCSRGPTTIEVLRMDPSTGTFEQIASVKAPPLPSFTSRPFIVGNSLWVNSVGRQGQWSHVRVNTSDGSIRQGIDLNEWELIMVLDRGDAGFLYCRQKGSPEGPFGDLEMGALDAQSCVLGLPMLHASASGELCTNLACNADASKFAALLVDKNAVESAGPAIGSTDSVIAAQASFLRLRFFDRNGQTVRDVALPSGVFLSQDLAWVGDTIWACAAGSFLRINADSGRVSSLSIGPLDSPALSGPTASPDGRFLAVAQPVFLKASDAAKDPLLLALVDLAQPDAPPKTVPFSKAAPPAASGIAP
jgi:hypothetical protein